MKTFRIIPAYAGQMDVIVNGQDFCEDHPRIRGTNKGIFCRGNIGIGSSPHTRDKFPFSQFTIVCGGIIPAYAGQIYKDDCYSF